MGFNKGRYSVSVEEILSETTEFAILNYYLGISEIPCLINSPIREDKNPSLGLYTVDGSRILYTDFSTKEKGDTFKLLSKVWNIPFDETLARIQNNIPKFNSISNTKTPTHKVTSIKVISNTDLQCKVREWRDYDIEYWRSFGIELPWLKYAEVYPISHKIIIKNEEKYIFVADKYAYAYVEHKEGKVTLKIYQPFNKNGFKWSNKHDSSVISLWTKIPKYGEKVCICSSLKDALCLWSNTGIPSIAVQGEGYKISNTAIRELKSRFKNIYICFDNDEAGLKDGVKLASLTGFTNIILPKFEGGKDISDLFKVLNNKELFKQQLLKLFSYE